MWVSSCWIWEGLLYTVTPHLTGIWNLPHYALPTINLVLFEKPALNSRKLARDKGIIWSCLIWQRGKYCHPFRGLWLHVSGCVLVQVCACVHIRFDRFFESVALLSDPLCEIVDIAFSVEVPIGVPRTADNNRRLIRSWKFIVHTHALQCTSLLSPCGPIGAPLWKCPVFTSSADVNPHILCDISLAPCCLYLWSPIFWEVMSTESQKSQTTDTLGLLYLYPPWNNGPVSGWLFPWVTLREGFGNGNTKTFCFTQACSIFCHHCCSSLITGFTKIPN